jgi:hypothetical protein
MDTGVKIYPNLNYLSMNRYRKGKRSQRISYLLQDQLKLDMLQFLSLSQARMVQWNQHNQKASVLSKP